MKALIMKARFLREERGFTLTEMMVTLVIWIVVLFALYNIFDMSIRVFSFGNNKVEATESARAGIDTMEREIRQAQRLDNSTNPPLFDIWGPTEIRFGRDLNGDGVIQKIGYVVYEEDPGKFALGRDNSSTGTTNTNLQPVVEHMDYQSPANTGLSFFYCKSVDPDNVSDDNCPAGFDVATSDTDPANWPVLVRMQLRIKVHKGLKDATQTLTTDVALRSRGGL
jgi:type II secretory pathway pseudopilin PulG